MDYKKRSYYMKVCNYFKDTYNLDMVIRFEEGISYITSKKNSYRSRYTDVYVNIAPKDVIRISMLEGFNKILAAERVLLHEAFHFILGHMQDEHNDRLKNIAKDMEVNSYIGLRHPFIHPEDYNLDPFLSWKEYYKILKNDQDKDKQEEQNNSGSNQDGSGENNTENQDSNGEDSEEQNIENPNEPNSEGGQNNQPEQNQDENWSAMGSQENTNNKDDSNDIDMSGDATQDGEGDSQNTEEVDIEKVVQDLIDAINRHEVFTDQVSIEGYNDNFEKSVPNPEMLTTKQIPDNISEVIRKIKAANANRFAIVPTQRSKSYMKYNNRQSNGDFILPGNISINSGYEKKLKPTYYIFIDVSGSTNGALNYVFNNIAEKFHHDIGATIIFYTNGIDQIITPSQEFVAHNATGGTDIYRAVREAVRKDEKVKFSKIFVFTDCQDHSLPYLDGRYDADVYFTSLDANKLRLIHQFRRKAS